MTQTTPLSLSLFGVAVALYCVAVFAFIAGFAFRRARISDIGLGAVFLAWPFHVGSIITRTLESDHWPLGNMYEYSTGIAFVIVTTYLYMAIRHHQRLLGLPAVMLAVALMGVAYMVYVPPGELVPALHSYWLTIHVTSMASASGILTFAFLFAMGYLARRWADAKAAGYRRAQEVSALQVSTGGGVATLGSGGSGLAGAVRRVLPPAKTLDLWSYRFVMLGFPIWSFGVMCGAIWGEHAWGRYWGWDPKETFAFITWVIFAIYMHARVTYGWKEKRAAMIAGLGMVSILFTLYAVNLWIAGLHSYARA